MDGIHPQEAGSPFRVGLAPFPNGHLGGPGLVDAATLPLIPLGVAKIVEMTVGNRLQSFSSGKQMPKAAVHGGHRQRPEFGHCCHLI